MAELFALTISPTIIGKLFLSLVLNLPYSFGLTSNESTGVDSCESLVFSVVTSAFNGKAELLAEALLRFGDPGELSCVPPAPNRHIPP
jgi:hypothetical protein